MNAPRSSASHRRAILDCSLFLTLIMLLGAAFLPAQAKSVPPQSDSIAIVTEADYLSTSGMTPMESGETILSPVPAALDDTTLAAVFASLNAALSPAMYLIDLPVIIH